MKKLFIFLVFIVISHSVTTFCHSNQFWAKTYGGVKTDHAFSVHQTTDGGYVVVGYSDSFGLGGYDIEIIKLNSEGTVLWEKTYGGIYNDYARSIQQTTDEGYIIAGYTFSSENFDFLILKLDSNGDATWIKTFGEDGSDTTRSVEQTADEGYIVLGNSNSFGVDAEDIWVLKLDENGAVSWQNTYVGNSVNTARSIQQTADGGYIIAGRTTISGTFNVDLWLLKLDSNGAISWQKTYGGEGFDGATSIWQTSDEGYIVSSWTTSFGVDESDIWLVKLDNLGDVTWQKTFGGAGEDYPVDIQQVSDEGYIIAGWTTSFGSGNRDYWLIKLDINGNISWERTYGGSLLDEAHFIRQTTDGGYIVAGDTVSFGKGSSDYFVLKLDPSGEIPGCNISQISNATVANTSILPQDITSTILSTTAIIASPSITSQDTSVGIRDACACEGDFDCDGDLDGTDAAAFKSDFGRSEYNFPCSNDDPCNGDFDCDGDVDGTDTSLLSSDFGRGPFQNPCPPCDLTIWCAY